MRNLKYNQPFSVDMVFFDGSIKWFKGKFNPDQKKHIIELIKLKLIQSIREFGLTAEDLGLASVEYIRVEAPIKEISTARFSTPINKRISTPINNRIDGGVRYG